MAKEQEPSNIIDDEKNVNEKEKMEVEQFLDEEEGEEEEEEGEEEEEEELEGSLPLCRLVPHTSNTKSP